MARYRKIDPRFWKDERVTQLNLEDKAIALYCITAQSNRIGCFIFSPGLAAEDLGMLPQTFMKRFINVCETLKWEWDERCRILFIPTWWKYNQPENNNNVIGCLKDLTDLPNSPLIIRFYNNLDYLNQTFHNTFTQTLLERYPKPYPKPYPTQEQEQEQDKTYSPNSDEFRLSNLLLSLIKERNIDYKQPNLQVWSKHIDLLIRVDKRPISEIESIIHSCQEDHFWQNNILSTEKLRKQYDQLKLKLLSATKPQSVSMDSSGRILKEI